MVLPRYPSCVGVEEAHSAAPHRRTICLLPSHDPRVVLESIIVLDGSLSTASSNVIGALLSFAAAPTAGRDTEEQDAISRTGIQHILDSTESIGGPTMLWGSMPCAGGSPRDWMNPSRSSMSSNRHAQ